MTPSTAASQASLPITNSQTLLKFMSSASVMPSNDFIFCLPLVLPPSLFPSIRVFSNELVLHIRWPKYWSFSFSISPSNEYSGLISFRIDWLDLLAVQGTLKSLLQHHSSKASILQGSAFFMVQLSHPCMTTGKIIALTRWTFVSKEMSLLFSMQSRLDLAFLPASLTRSFLPVSSSGPFVPLPQALPLFSPQNILSSFPPSGSRVSFFLSTKSFIFAQNPCPRRDLSQACGHPLHPPVHFLVGRVVCPLHFFPCQPTLKCGILNPLKFTITNFLFFHLFLLVGG